SGAARAGCGRLVPAASSGGWAVRARSRRPGGHGGPGTDGYRLAQSRHGDGFALTDSQREPGADSHAQPESHPYPVAERAKPVPPSPTPSKAHRRAASPSLTASGSQSSITAGTASMTGLSYDGVADVQTATGTVRMLMFSMRSMTLSGGTVLTVNEHGHALVT